MTRLIEESLRQGASVVVDNTNLTPAVRENLVRLGSGGYEIWPEVTEALATR